MQQTADKCSDVHQPQTDHVKSNKPDCDDYSLNYFTYIKF